MFNRGQPHVYDSRGCLSLFYDSRGSMRENVHKYSGPCNGQYGDWDNMGVQKLIAEWTQQFARVRADPKNKGSKPVVFEITELVFNNNRIGDVGVEKMFNFFKREKVQIKVVKLWKNEIGDWGRYWIADYLKLGRQRGRFVGLGEEVGMPWL